MMKYNFKFLKILVYFFIIYFLGFTHNLYAQHVVLISIDGSTPDFYMDSFWEAPHLKELKKNGIYAETGAKSVFPSITYPAHTSIITGANPINHGIYFNSPFESAPGHANWYSCVIKTRTIWEAIREAGLSSASIYWPVTVGAPVDFLFPVRRPGEGEVGNQLSVTLPYVRPRDLLSDVEKETGKKLTGESFLIREDFRESKNIALLSNYIIRKYKPNFTAVHFVGIDHQRHAHGRNATQVKEILRITDSLIGTILQSVKDAGIGDSTTIIITGDHGHINTNSTFSPNVYLYKHKYLDERGWKAKFHSGFLYLKNQNDDGIVESISSILKNTEEFKQGDFVILNRDTLNKLGADPNARIALATKEGIKITNNFKGEATKKFSGKASGHGYLPSYSSMNTSFIISGARVTSPGSLKQEIRITDIAALISKLLDLNFDAPDGTLIPGIIEEKN